MEKEDIERARKLLKIVDIIERYNYYLMRRAIGTLYIVIVGLISLIILFIGIFTEIITLPPSLEGILYFLSFIFFFIIIIPLGSLILRIPTLYSPDKKSGKGYGITWMIVGASILIASSIIYTSPLPDYYFAFILQCLMSAGQFGNYLASRSQIDYPGKVEKEYFYFGLPLILFSPLILIFPEYAWLIVIIFVSTGTFLFGIYLIITAPKVFKKWEAENVFGNTKEASGAIQG
ncbi:MAG: hypothetical protein DRZ80_02490 [Thermoprotei archaeon]|nr:MAG: hypothetical protein DRZ80_02490 [Thermoprotei archaeon]